MIIRSKDRRIEDIRENVIPAVLNGDSGWQKGYGTYTCFYPETHWEKVLDWITVPEYITIHILAKHWPYLQKR